MELKEKLRQILKEKYGMENDAEIMKEMSRLILVENIRGMQAIMKKWRTKNNDEF